jgi:hypothetical protein
LSAGGVDAGVCAAAMDDANTTMALEKAAARDKDTTLLVILTSTG